MDVLKKQKELAEFTKKVKEMSLDELKKLEQEIIAEGDKINEEVAKLEYDLPAKDYAVVAEGIRTLLNKQTVTWQFTLGMVSMFDFWNPEKRSKKIPYPMLDSTLKTLGDLQFTGYNEWAAVVAINKYFEPLREKYIISLEKIYDNAAKHNTVVDQIKLCEPVEMQQQMINE